MAWRGLPTQDRLLGSSILLTENQSRLPSFRHRHLESSSYHTLVRIFSLCLELDECPDSPLRESMADPSLNLEAPESSSAGKNSIASCGIVGQEEPSLGDKNTAKVSTCPYSKDYTLNRDGVGIATIDELGCRDKDLAEVTGFVLTGLLGQHKESLEDQNEVYSDKLGCVACEKPQSGNSQDLTSHGMNDFGKEAKDLHSSTNAELQNTIVNPTERALLHESAATQSPGESIFHNLGSNIAQDDLFSLLEGLQGDAGNNIMKNDFAKPLPVEDHIQFQRENNIELGWSPSVVFADKTDATILCQSQKSSFAVPSSLREIYKGDSDRGLEMEISTHKLIEAGAQHKKSILTNDSCDKLDARPESAVINDMHKCIEEGLYPISSEKAYADPKSLIVHLDSSDDIEEGQIPGDFLSSDESFHDITQLEDQNLSRKAPFDTCMILKSGTGQDSVRDNFEFPKQHLPSQNESSDDEAVKVGTKRKKGPMTAERKAKKKEAKRRKRAQQGVKRLKLQMIVKPKTVQNCNFFLKGRCQQGDACKFSHATTPLTKSTPCKFFASDSCMKSDDCPFDHQLSNYPCHNYLNNGMCSRGDRCKFSHKISEGSSPAAVTSNLVSLSTSEKLEPRKNTPLTSERLELKKKNWIERGIVKASDASKIKPQNSSSVDQILAKPPRKPLVVPKGIRFLSLGDEPSKILHKKPLFQKSISSEDCNGKNGIMFPGHSHLGSSIFAEKPLHEVHTDPDRMSVRTALDSASARALKDLKSKKLTEGACLTADSRSLQSEISEASKILEEFLFV